MPTPQSIVIAAALDLPPVGPAKTSLPETPSVRPRPPFSEDKALLVLTAVIAQGHVVAVSHLLLDGPLACRCSLVTV